MNSELLRTVDAIHRDKNIEKEIVFQGIEMAVIAAAKKHFPENDEVTVTIDRATGALSAAHNSQPISPEVLGRIAAQLAKQLIIQKIREAERDSLHAEYIGRVGQLVSGIVQRVESGAVTVNISKTEAILPRSEQIPGESYRVSERVQAVIIDVRKTNQRVKIVLSRTHPDFVRRLFEKEIPEIAERVIEIKSVAREAGYRAKVAVLSIDSKVDCVGACVGVRGTRIKNVVDELAGERIDIVRWNDSLQVMIPNALQPAEIDDVMLFPMLSRAIVLVKEDQLSLAIGRRGQNVRLASKLVGWDIEIMTIEELDEQIQRAEQYFVQIPGVDATLVDKFVEQGFLSFDDMAVMGPEDLAQLEGLDVVKAEEVIAYAEREAERMERAGISTKTRRLPEDIDESAAKGRGQAPKKPTAEMAPEPVDLPAAEAQAAEAGGSQPAVLDTEGAAADAGIDVTSVTVDESPGDNGQSEPGEAASPTPTPESATTP
jgi:N utilization substance protein A